MNFLIFRDVESDCFKQVCYVDANFHKNIQNILYRHLRNGHQATMTIVHYEITTKLATSKIIDAACAVSYITKDKAFYFAALVAAECLNQICNQSRMHQKPLWKLQRDFVYLSHSRLHHFQHRLVHLVVVVLRQHLHCFAQQICVNVRKFLSQSLLKLVNNYFVCFLNQL